MPLDMTALPAVSTFSCERICSWQRWKHSDSEALQKHTHHSTTLGSGADMAAGNLRQVFIQCLLHWVTGQSVLRRPHGEIPASFHQMKDHFEEPTWNNVNPTEIATHLKEATTPPGYVKSSSVTRIKELVLAFLGHWAVSSSLTSR
ncbi:uncharacterized protein LOC119167711 isoform X1 [Rhipicephalus microplus]|uniref:uncharacterized protein LOC119167711 isoform X1 n=1 Tax=Rhipicephalus microplus TaxID=6941 RepID=UPI003F6BA6C2